MLAGMTRQENNREKRGRAFVLKFLPQFFYLLESLVAGGLELLASRLSASEGGFQLNTELEFLLLEVAEFGDNRAENRCDEVYCRRGDDRVQVGIWNAGMRRQVAEVDLG